MAYGDKHFLYHTAGSSATSAATAHSLWGTYDGLSQLNASEVLFIQIFASGGDLRLSANATPATNDVGLRIMTATSYYDLPPVTVYTARLITIAREGSNNTTPLWTIWKRSP